MTPVVAAVARRFDSWVNALTGLGTLRDKLTHAQMAPNVRMGDATLESLYNADDLAAKIVDKIAREATRRGFTLELEGYEREEGSEAARGVTTAFSKLGGMPALRQAWIWGRLYGGGAVYVGADDGQLDQSLPLNETAIRQILFLTVLAKPQLTVASRYQDPRHPKYGEAETYNVHRTMSLGGGAGGLLAGSTGVVLHETRLVVFGGTLTARLYNPTPDGWDDSVLQRVHQVLRETATTWQSTAHLVSDASQGVLKIANLVDLIATGGQEALRTRIEMMDMARSVCRAILVDAERENFERVATSFAGLPDMMDRFMQRAAAAAEMPVTILWGRSPAGMNATGESDVRGWYDTVQDAQTDVLQPRLERALTLLMLSKDGPTKGKLPEAWKVCWNALWQPTDKEVADTRKVDAETVAKLVEAQIMLPEEAALDLAQSGEFSTIDVETRQAALKSDTEPPEDDEPPEPDDDDEPAGGGGGTDENVQQQALNGAQVTSLLEVLDKVAVGDLPRQSGIEVMIVAYQLTREEAERLMGDIGAGFKIDKPVPPASPLPGMPPALKPPVPTRPPPPPAPEE